MKLENQVVSLELAKKLKELGVPQASLFSYVGSRLTNYSDQENFSLTYNLDRIDDTTLPKYLKRHGTPISSEYAAFTVAELGEMLPEYTRTTKLDDKYFVTNCEALTDVNADGNTEADARAKMLIYLLGNKLVQV